MERRLHRTVLAYGSRMRLDELTCEGGAGRRTPFEEDPGTAAIIVRSGGFLREEEGEEHFVDSSGGFISRDGVAQRFRYIGDGHDVCTVLGVLEDVHDEYLAHHKTWRVITDATFDMRHRLLVSACRRGTDALAASEGLLMLLEAITPQPESGSASRPATGVAHRRLVTRTQEALATGMPGASLEELAGQVSASPHHLSRVFRRVTGRTITAYRNVLRLRAVLEGIAAGESNLASLASRYGFADHAHLTRTVRRHTSASPSALRAVLLKGEMDGDEPKPSMNVQAPGVG